MSMSSGFLLSMTKVLVNHLHVTNPSLPSGHLVSAVFGFFIVFSTITMVFLYTCKRQWRHKLWLTYTFPDITV